MRIMSEKEIEAIRTILKYIGEDPDREGLVKTPERFLRAWKDEFFTGYSCNPIDHLKTTFEEVEGYKSIVLLSDIGFTSHCEHHLVPITGTAHIAYMPNKRVVGISKIVRVLHAYANRLQIQERLTQQVADCLYEGVSAKGVAVIIEAQHHCMCGRGVKTPSTMKTMTIKGDINPQEVFSLVHR